MELAQTFNESMQTGVPEYGPGFKAANRTGEMHSYCNCLKWEIEMNCVMVNCQFNQCCMRGYGKQ